MASAKADNDLHMSQTVIHMADFNQADEGCEAKSALARFFRNGMESIEMWTCPDCGRYTNPDDEDAGSRNFCDCISGACKACCDCAASEAPAAPNPLPIPAFSPSTQYELRKRKGRSAITNQRASSRKITDNAATPSPQKKRKLPSMEQTACKSTRSKTRRDRIPEGRRLTSRTAVGDAFTSSHLKPGVVAEAEQRQTPQLTEVAPVPATSEEAARMSTEALPAPMQEEETNSVLKTSALEGFFGEGTLTDTTDGCKGEPITSLDWCVEQGYEMFVMRVDP